MVPEERAERDPEHERDEETKHDVVSSRSRCWTEVALETKFNIYIITYLLENL